MKELKILRQAQALLEVLEKEFAQEMEDYEYLSSEEVAFDLDNSSIELFDKSMKKINEELVHQDWASVVRVIEESYHIKIGKDFRANFPGRIEEILNNFISLKLMKKAKSTIELYQKQARHIQKILDILMKKINKIKRSWWRRLMYRSRFEELVSMFYALQKWHKMFKFYIMQTSQRFMLSVAGSFTQTYKLFYELVTYFTQMGDEMVLLEILYYIDEVITIITPSTEKSDINRGNVLNYYMQVELENLRQKALEIF